MAKPARTNSRQPKKAKPRPLPINRSILIGFLLLIAFLLFTYKDKIQSVLRPAIEPTPTPQATTYLKEISLPAPSKSSRLSIEQALNQRRNRNLFTDRSLNTKQFSQLLWSLQGVTAAWGERTAPSIKDTYPLEIYAIVLKVDGLESGLYRYIPGDLQPIHKLGLLKAADLRTDLLEATRQQSAINNSPLVFIITGNFPKMTTAFNNQPHDENVYLEAGHAAQNLFLQVESLSLGAFAITNFDPSLTYKLLLAPINERPIYILPVGYRSE